MKRKIPATLSFSFHACTSWCSIKTDNSNKGRLVVYCTTGPHIYNSPHIRYSIRFGDFLLSASAIPLKKDEAKKEVQE